MRKGYEIAGIYAKPCHCGGFPIEAGQSEEGFRILCEECGRTSRSHADLASALRDWNRIAKRKTFWYCLVCQGKYCDFPYASNEYLNTHLIHRSRITCKIHCWWLNMKEKLNGGEGKRNGHGGDR